MGTPIDKSVVRVSTRPSRLEIILNADGDEKFETKQMGGRDYLVVPAVILNEGVLWSSNADNPALALAEEFGIFPEGWDGRPVVYGHPKKDGTPVHANQPDLWDSEVIGQLFNTKMKKRKLVTYMWVDKEKSPQEVVEGLNNGESFEVSTGLFALEEKSQGTFTDDRGNEEEYKVIWRNIVPDHLAILPKGAVGACSLEDGCGAPRANQGKGNSVANQPASANPLATASVVSSGNPNGPDGSLLVSQAPATAASIAAVASTAPATSQAACGCQEKNNTLVTNLRTNIKKAVFGFLNQIGLNVNELSDVDKRTAIELALSEAYDDKGYCYILALFEREVVYAHLDNETYNWVTYKIGYSVQEGGKVTLRGEPTRVRAETKYVDLDVRVNGEQPASNGNQSNQPTREGSNMSNTPAAQAAATDQSAAATTAAPAATATTVSAPAEQLKANSLEDLLKFASPEIANQVKSLAAYQVERSKALINGLKDKVGLSEDELKSMDISVLEKMHAKLNATTSVPAVAPATTAATQATSTAAPADYSGAAGASPAPKVPAANEAFTPFEPVFPLKPATAGQ